MRLLKVDKIEEARCKLLEAAGEKVPDTECTGFMESCGRILAQDLPYLLQCTDLPSVSQVISPKHCPYHLPLRICRPWPMR